MKVENVAEIVNSLSEQFLGKTAVEGVDLSNVVDLGREILTLTEKDYENFMRTLVDHIGKVVFVNRPYSGSVPSVLMDSWEYGAILQKITAETPKAVENQSWNLQNGTTYNQDIFYKPVVSSKFFSDRASYEVPISIATTQVKSAFSDATQLNAFFSMIYNAIDRGMSINSNTLIKGTIANMIGVTLHSLYPDADYTTKSYPRAVNLLKLYKDRFTATLTADKCLTDPDFIRYASFIISIYTDRLAEMSSLFNGGGKDRFTPRDKLHVVLLSDFAKASEVFLQSGTYHKELVKFPNYETIPVWQGSGTDYSFDSASEVHVNVKDGAGTAEVTASGILGVMFDHDALGVTNYNRRVTTHYNAKAEFTNNYYKMDAGYFNDFNENFVVFFVA